MQDLSCNAGTSDAPSLAGTLTSLVVVWEDSTPGNFEVFLRRSTDGGATFSPVVNVSGTSFNSGRPSAAVDPALPLNISVAWEEATANRDIGSANFFGPADIWFARSTDGGATFSPQVNLSNTVGASFEPTVIVAMTSVYVVWQDGKTKGSNCDASTPCAILFRASSDGGANFRNIITLSKGQTLNATGPKMVAHGGRIYAVWMAAAAGDCLRTTGNCEIYASRSLDGGVNWTDPFNLSGTPENSFDPDLVVVPGPVDDTVYVAWDDGPSKAGDIFFRRSTDSGFTFSTPTQNLANTPTAYSNFPALGAMSSFVFAAWLESVGSTSQVFFSRSTDGGATFSDPKSLSTTLFTVAFPRVTAGLASHVAVWWEDYSSGPAEILLARSADGGTSFSVTNLSNNQGQSLNPRMIGNGKNGAAVWVDQSLGGAAEVFFRTF